jgi:hypothetical protein
VKLIWRWWSWGSHSGDYRPIFRVAPFSPVKVNGRVGGTCQCLLRDRKVNQIFAGITDITSQKKRVFVIFGITILLK